MQEVSCRYKIHSMKQATLNLGQHCKKTRKRDFLEEMEQVVPWAELVSLIAPYYPEGRNGPSTVCSVFHAAHPFLP